MTPVGLATAPNESIWTRQLFPTPLWAYPAIFAGLSVFVGYVFAHDSRLIGWVHTVFAGFALTLLWTVVNWLVRRRLASTLLIASLCFGTLVITAALWATALRVGQVDCGPQGGAYWSSDNQTYRFKPAWVLRPLRVAALGVGWYAASFVAVLIIPRRPRPH